MQKDDGVNRSENNSLKRKLEEDDVFLTFSSSPSNKRWKYNNNSREVEEHSQNVTSSSSSSSRGWKPMNNTREFEENSKDFTFSNKRNKTFANDRLKNLRTKLKADVACDTMENSFERPKNPSVANTRTVFPSKTNPQGYETNQNSADRRLSKIRTNQGDKWKGGHKNIDNNSNISPSWAATSKFSPEKSYIDKNRDNNKKINANVYSNNFKDDYVPKQNAHEDSNFNDWNASINVNSSFRPIEKKTNSHQESSAHDDIKIIYTNPYFRYDDCTPSTSKDKPVIKHKRDETNENAKEVRWNNSKDYSQIVNLLYKKYFEKNETQVKVFDKTSLTPGTTDIYDLSMDWGDDDVVKPSPARIVSNELRELYFVVDTNILIHDLSILQDIINGSKGSIKPIIFLPWMVISELDSIKDNKNSSASLRQKAQKANRYINENLLGGSGSIKGQTIDELDEQKFIGNSPDDKILSCCLFVKEKYHKMIFVSNDCQLRYKVQINEIPAISTSDILNASKTITFEDSSETIKIREKTQKLFEEMSTCCSFIICECAKEAYGRVWNKMDMLSHPPWPLETCVKIFRKYWRCVFEEKFLKQFLQSVDDFEEALKVFNTFKSRKSLKEFVEAYSGLCFFFKDLQEHKEFVETSIKDVKAIVRTD